MLRQAPRVSLSAGVQGCAIVGQKSLRDAVGGDTLVEHGDRGVTGLPWGAAKEATARREWSS